MTGKQVADLELDLQEELMCLLSMSFPRSSKRDEFNRVMVSTIRDVFARHSNHSPRSIPDIPFIPLIP